MVGILQIAYNISSIFTQAGEFSFFYLIIGAFCVQVFLKVTSVFFGDDKSPIIADLQHFVSLLVQEHSSYARDQLPRFFGTSSLPVSDLKGPER